VIAKRIVKIAVPITLSSAVISLTRVVDLFMILRRLQAIGYSEAAANAVYGSYSTLAISMFNLPAAFVTPIALALVPVLTSAINGRDKYKEINTLNSSLRLTGLITLPASLGLSVFSRPVLEFVFKGEDSAINTAAPLLSVLGISVFFSCMMTVTNAVLQAYGKERLPLVSMLVGSAVKIVLSYVLIGIPQINVFGASISTFACALAVSAMNLAYIKKCAPEVAGPIKLFGGALGASVFSVAVGGGVYFLLAARIGRSSALTLATVGLTAIVFVISAVKTGAVGREDILLLPKGEKIYGTLKKVKLIQK
jgi:stage V sporulation protein B